MRCLLSIMQCLCNAVRPSPPPPPSDSLPPPSHILRGFGFGIHNAPHPWQNGGVFDALPRWPPGSFRNCGHTHYSPCHPAALPNLLHRCLTTFWVAAYHRNDKGDHRRTPLSTLVHHGIIYVPSGYKALFPQSANMKEIRGGSPWVCVFAGADDSRKPWGMRSRGRRENPL